MATYEERCDKRFHETTIDVLNDIEQRLGTIEPADDQVQSSMRYAAAYGILRGYIESLLVNFAESFSEDQLAEIRIVLDQLRTLVREDEHVDEATRAKLNVIQNIYRRLIKPLVTSLFVGCHRFDTPFIHSILLSLWVVEMGGCQSSLTILWRVVHSFLGVEKLVVRKKI